ncbi:N-acetylmuramic acid 6-phosphate phosphatase [Nitrosomonas stercoris]|uniref:N-acetylmuramic acid 6-phosphate phosphatase n=1 Tax=Nitrosomonas stercoris TaxID=1444684 RepID=A0A4Y1YLA7_9PROT|nr:N-acetylmuramic acid 6-phosphate phosphatase [Nitrosomonas stercoris]
MTGKAVLFDFDGTIADTAPDLGHALNRQRIARNHPPLPIELVRMVASAGARGLLELGFGLKPEDPDYSAMREEFLDFYTEQFYRDTCLFPGIAELLEHLDKQAVPWGVVTNKPAKFTQPLMRLLGLHHRAGCIISGDDTAHTKPHPEPLLAACRQMNVLPNRCIYLGDDIRDVQASLAAGIIPIVALYGYLGNGAPPDTWGAAELIDHPNDLLCYL